MLGVCPRIINLNVIGGELVRFLNVVLLCVGLAYLASCSSVNHKVGSVLNLDTDMKLQVVVSENVNPDERENSSPIFIRLYELSDPKAFERADFIDIYEQDSNILEADLVAKQELKPFTPGEVRTERFVLAKETRFVALFAEFYQYKDAKSKIIFPITASNVVRNSIKIQLSGTEIKLLDN